MPAWARDSLWRQAAAVPSLDLNFAVTKNIGPLVTFTRASNATYIDSAGTLQTAATDVPRFDHNPTTGESLGLLVEEARTNLCLHSEDISNAAWVLNGGAVTTNTTAAPNGQTTADTFTVDASTIASVHQQITCLASTTYTWSCFVRLGTLPVNDFRIAVRDDTNGAFIAQDVVPNVTPVTTEWRRVVYTFTTPAGCVLVRPYPLRSLAGIGGTVFLWGAQLEAGAFPTSYIPTTTAAATRSADVASITGANFSSWYNQTEGTVFARYSFPQSPNTGGARVIQFVNATAANLIWLRAQGGVNRVYDVTNASVSQAAFNQGAYAEGVEYKAALATKANDFGFAENGGAAQSDSSGTMPSVDQLGIGMESIGNGSQGNVHIRRLTYWPQRLANSTLQAITQ
jgi:hypothetical protein